MNTESLCTEIFVYSKQVINSERNARKLEIDKFKSHKITGL